MFPMSLIKKGISKLSALNLDTKKMFVQSNTDFILIKPMLSMLTKSVTSMKLKLILFHPSLLNGIKPILLNKLKLPKNTSPYLSILKNLATANLDKPWLMPLPKATKTNELSDQFPPILGLIIPISKNTISTKPAPKSFLKTKKLIILILVLMIVNYCH